ncbi:MAG: DUF1349 domain-containing protein [Bacteroidota bacterium]|nr:DUF1349 domain-containing protein [Bacteroidota bacterium]
MENLLQLSEFRWINKPRDFSLENDRLTILTDPETDFWQRTYYDFRNDNAPAFLKEVSGDFTFAVKTEFETKTQYDQCGIILYQDSANWIKASVEYENEKFARLGSVVTNLGYSDWATTDIPAITDKMWYRLSRIGQDFYIENSINSIDYNQMRMLHMHKPLKSVRIGVYACSPLQSSFKAVFSNFELGECKWQDHIE